MDVLKRSARAAGEFFCAATFLALALPLAGCLDFDALSSNYDSGGIGVDGGADLQMVPAHCTDRRKDSDETDVDCGGSCGAGCGLGQGCNLAGDCYTGSCSAPVCVEASGPPSWVAVAPLQIARQRLAAAADPQGRVYAIGGSPTPANEERFDPSTGAWSTIAVLPTERFWLGAALGGDGHVYALGGEVGAIANPTVNFYNTTTESWSGAQTMPVATEAMAAFAGPMGEVALVGGFTSLGDVTSEVEFFAPAGTGWSTISAAPTPRDRLSGTTGSDGNYYVFGGHHVDMTGIDVYTDEVDTLTPMAISNNDVWTIGPTLPSARAETAAALGGDKRIYVTGGIAFKTGGTATVTLGEVIALSPTLGRWLTVTPLTTPRHAHAMTVGGDGRLYVIGGAGGGSVLTSVEAYGPSIALTPNQGPAGSMVSISGGNFAKNARVQFFWGTATQPSGNATTDDQGALVGAPLIAAPQAIGAGKLRAVDDKSFFPTFADFAVK